MDKRISRTDWFHEAKWGVFMHFLGACGTGGAEVDAEAWNRRVDAFDVIGLANQLLEAKAKYFVLTLGQNSGHYCSPNETYDRITGIRPSRCARRDLVSELYDALSPHGIRLMVYLPSHAPMSDPAATRKLGFVASWNFGGWSPPPGTYTDADAAGNDARLSRGQRNWESVIRDWSLRWERNVSGWWFDGCYYNDEMYQHADEPNFKSFAAAARAGNPDSIVAWNPGVEYPPYTVDPEEDYTSGEICDLQRVDAPGRWEKQAQFHILSFLGKFWGSLPIRFTATEAIENTLTFTNYGGVVTWDVPLTVEGLINPEAFAVLKEVGKAVDVSRALPDRTPLKVVRPSVNFLKVPSIGGSDESNGLIRLTLKNCSDERMSGEVEVTIEPASFARIEGAKCITYDLLPGAEAITDIVFNVEETVSTDTAAKVFLTRSGDNRRFAYSLPKREKIAIPRLASLPSLAEFADAMKSIPSRRISTDNGRGLADVKLAIADGHLAIVCRVGDQILRQTPDGWDGSCMEVFGVTEQGDRINQLFFVPATDHLPAKALKLIPAKYHTKIQIVPAPELKFESWQVAGGYTSAALIPLSWWLNRSDAPGHFFFEIVINTGVDMNKFARAAMFGSESAPIQSESYALASII